MSDDETPPPRRPAENSTIDEVVERTRRMLRKSADLLQSSRDLLNKVHQPAPPKGPVPPAEQDGEPGREQDADGRGSS